MTQNSIMIKRVIKQCEDNHREIKKMQSFQSQNEKFSFRCVRSKDHHFPSLKLKIRDWLNGDIIIVFAAL